MSDEIGAALIIGGAIVISGSAICNQIAKSAERTIAHLASLERTLNYHRQGIRHRTPQYQDDLL